MKERHVDVAVIGGGAAGMAAAVSAFDSGAENVLIIERNDYLGGVLQQCIHNGFGLHRFGEDLTGVEFAGKYEKMVSERGIKCLMRTFVIDLSRDRLITAVNPELGLLKIRAGAVVLAMGCRERTRNNLLIPGTRGAGIMTAGTAQRYLNIDGYLPGEKIVILGSGDIGLIMARQFVLEGASVEAVVEIMPYSAGLPRNMKQCIEDFDIPVYYGSTVSRIRGRERVTSVSIGKVDEDRRIIEGTEFEVPCDTLLISAGLIPENELTEQAGILMSETTKGAVVDESGQTSAPGIFSCGNVLHVHDLVDFVSEEGERTGIHAAEYALCGKEREKAGYIHVKNGQGAGGIVPQLIRKDSEEKTVSLMFRPKNRYRDAYVTAESGGKKIFSRKYPALVPAQMCSIDIPKERLSDEVTVYIQGGEVR